MRRLLAALGLAALLASCAPDDPDPEPYPEGLNCDADEDCPNGPPAWSCLKGQCRAPSGGEA